jgi:hypothetical protein
MCMYVAAVRLQISQPITSGRHRGVNLSASYSILLLGYISAWYCVCECEGEETPCIQYKQACLYISFSLAIAGAVPCILQFVFYTLEWCITNWTNKYVHKNYLAFFGYLCCPNLVICSPAVTLHWPWRLLADTCGKDRCPTFFFTGDHTIENFYPKWVVK